MTVHNEILKRRPDLGAVMAAPWYMDRKGEVPEGKQPYFQIPIFNYFKVRSSCPLCTLMYVNRKSIGRNFCVVFSWISMTWTCISGWTVHAFMVWLLEV